MSLNQRLHDMPPAQHSQTAPQNPKITAEQLRNGSWLVTCEHADGTVEPMGFTNLHDLQVWLTGAFAIPAGIQPQRPQPYPQPQISPYVYTDPEDAPTQRIPAPAKTRESVWPWPIGGGRVQ